MNVVSTRKTGHALRLVGCESMDMDNSLNISLALSKNVLLYWFLVRVFPDCQIMLQVPRSWSRDLSAKVLVLVSSFLKFKKVLTTTLVKS